MKPVLISPEGDDPREFAVLQALFTAGLDRCHLRKPSWSAAKVENWLQQAPVDWRARIVLHQHHELAGRYELGGRHWKDDASAPASPSAVAGFTSRSCHDLPTLRAAMGHYDAVFFSPLFPSLSKPGHGPAPDFSPAELSSLLRGRSSFQRRTEVIALGGITASNAAQAFALGFDNIALLGAVWQSPDPIAEFEKISLSFPPPAERLGFRGAKTPLMCLTQEGIALTPVEQVTRLCAAGARWIQLRLKQADAATWLATAREVVAICRRHGAVCIINDNVDVALAVGADGVHLGKLDLGWKEARVRLGPARILGGTVNDAGDVARVKAAGCLDYVGVGPLRFTTTKQKLAPVLGVAGIHELVAQLDGLPAWAIGGVVADDLPALRGAGASGVAVTGALFAGGSIEDNFAALQAAWSEMNFNRTNTGQETRATAEANL